MTNPYANQRDYQMWRRAVSRVETFMIDPVVEPKFQIAKSSLISTAGSCFAQHISKKLKQIGFGYYVPEAGSNFVESERRRRNYGVFSARYGNIYTAAQLLQLFEEAVEGRIPLDRAWKRPDGRFIDPYRQQVEPDGFADENEVIASRNEHLEYVRATFLKSDVFVFTLGLTESWRSKRDGFVFPLAPGVVGGAFDPQQHEFVNFGVEGVSTALITFLDKLKAHNDQVRVLLTVSPVPLIATYENRHVLVSTTYSKSVLRVAADIASRRYDWVDYFPSYEIITASFSAGLYYESDYREVTPQGVAHAMRCFVQNYVSQDKENAALSISTDLPRDEEIICDELAIDAIRPGQSGVLGQL